MALYINGMGNISPQRTWSESALPGDVVDHASAKLSCIEPDYTQFIDPKNLRRMSRIIRMGVTSAFIALKQANVKVPDAIITGTGYGCLEDTGAFLSKMISSQEVALNPTPFIQSTHNTIGSQIALLLQCQGYNQTYAHGSFSFESVLLDAMMQSQENPGLNILAGGVDEITLVSHAIQSRFGIFRDNVESSLNLFSENKGALNGEGCAYFVLSGNKTSTSIARIDSVQTLYKPDAAKLAETIDDMKAPSLVLSGRSGDAAADQLLDECLDLKFSQTPVGVFKHLCGEFPVASAFACWLAAGILNSKKIPSPVSFQTDLVPKKILIINQYFGTHYSLIQLSAC